MTRKISYTIWPTNEQFERLKALSAATRVPMAEYVRDAIDLILERHAGMIEEMEALHDELGPELDVTGLLDQE